MMVKHFYVVTGPLFYPVSLEEVYRQCRVITEGSPPTSDDDLLLTSLIASATDFVEKQIRRSLVRRTLCMTMPVFPFGRASSKDSGIGTNATEKNRVGLLMPPVSSISAVRYYDSDNALQELSASNYFLSKGEVPSLVFIKSFSAPQVYERPDAVQVEYIAGYDPIGSPPDDQADFAYNIPKSIKQALMLQVELLYNDHMEKEASAIERARDSLLHPYMVQISV